MDPVSQKKPMDGDLLFGMLNIKIQEVIDEWASRQDVKVKHDGALITVHERPDLLMGFRVVIDWPFTYSLKV